MGGSESAIQTTATILGMICVFSYRRDENSQDTTGVCVSAAAAAAAADRCPRECKHERLRLKILIRTGPISHLGRPFFVTVLGRRPRISCMDQCTDPYYAKQAKTVTEGASNRDEKSDDITGVHILAGLEPAIQTTTTVLGTHPGRPFLATRTPFTEGNRIWTPRGSFISLHNKVGAGRPFSGCLSGQGSFKFVDID